MFKSLSVRDFRNIESCSFQFSPKINLFVGNNAQGKTNILEALCLVSQGSSFRQAENQFFIRHGQNFASVKATKIENHLEYQLQVSISGNTRSHSSNEKKVNSSFLKENFLNIIFSPESLEIVKQSSERRRELVDDMAISFDSTSAKLLTEFRKCLRTRNRILKDHHEGRSPKNLTLSLLEAINPQFLKLATDVTCRRMAVLNAIIPDANFAMQNISRNKNVDISVEYVASGENILSFTPSEVTNRIQKRLQNLTDAELASGLTLVGPHRHDISFLYHRKDSRFFCSQGQQRALILSFKMAQIVYHRKVHESYPVLMLDDVLSELDPEKRDSLIAFLSELNTQIFITTTDLSLPSFIGPENCLVMNVREGKFV